jgi:hypothetical protein
MRHWILDIQFYYPITNQSSTCFGNKQGGPFSPKRTFPFSLFHASLSIIISHFILLVSRNVYISVRILYKYFENSLYLSLPLDHPKLLFAIEHEFKMYASSKYIIDNIMSHTHTKATQLLKIVRTIHFFPKSK